MKNKGFIIFLTILISLLCVYYLSFTFVSQGIQKKATEASIDAEGNVNLIEKQRYLDSIWGEPVYHLFGIESKATSYTYKQIKETELNLGLDLQGGMHVTLEVSPVDILKGLSGGSQDSDFLNALDKAKKNIRGTQLNFVSEFYKEFKAAAPDKKLSYIFATATNRGKIELNSTDDEILKIINEEVEGAIERSFNILRTRIDRFGTSQPNIQRLQGTGRIQIELPGVDNPARVRRLLQGVAKLEFWEVHEPQDYFPVIQQINEMLVAEMKRNARAGTQTDEKKPQDDLSSLLVEGSQTDSLATAGTQDQMDSLLNMEVSPLISMLRDNRSLVYELNDTAKVNRIFARPDVKALIPPTMKFLWGIKPMKLDKTTGPDLIELYAIKSNRQGKAPLGGEVITDARSGFDERGRSEVTMQMNSQGAKVWRQLTRANVNRRIAIVLDNFVYSAPNVINEIPNGSSSISGDYSIEDTKDMANILKAGALPAPTTIVEDAVIGPSLGKVAQAQGLKSIMAGLLIVIFFMIIYYAKGGVIANVALFFNIFFILGILANLGAALTLPGIAGIVLTIGMSIDANVLIFERIKEELRNGAGLKAAINSGYQKAFSSILDANVTTFITGVLLYVLGQGPVKGFAVTLMIGIGCSFFSAVFISRVIVEWFSKKGDKSTLSFANAFSRNLFTNLNFDFIGKRKIAYAFSATIIGLGIVAMIVKGITMGVDFKGGRSYVVQFSGPQVPSVMKQALLPYFDNQGTEVKTFGSSNILKVTTSYLIDDETDTADDQVREALINGLEAYSGLRRIDDGSRVDATTFAIGSSAKVSATIADDIKTSSYKAGILAILAIFIYIVLRFRKWQFGLGATLALLHDAMFVLSAFAIANMFGISLEADQVFVGAILTVIGYSINDTVVIFDRIRENMGIKAGSDLVRVVNDSMNTTMSRTIITSATTLLVVLILFLFGGAALKAFSFALLIGIMVGTYSTLFIAAPVVVDLNTEKK
jgi:SecD/SecF fusion protein